MPPRLRRVPSAGSSRARAAPSPLVLLPPPRGVYIGHAPGLGCASRGSRCPTRPATVQRDPRAGGARAHRDARRGSTWSRDPPGHAPHARRARGRRARAPPWGLGVVRSGQLGAARCCGCRGPPACLGDSPACAGHRRRVPEGAGRRESHFRGRHRTSRSRIRCLRGVQGRGAVLARGMNEPGRHAPGQKTSASRWHKAAWEL